MNIIDRYLLHAVVLYTALVVFVLAALAGFVNFVGELDAVGTGSYGVPEALAYVTMRLPQVAFEILPMAVLIGALLGLGELAGRSELVIMRAAGISVWRLAAAVAVAGLVLLLVTALIGEFIAPPLDRYARQYRTAHRSDALAIAGTDSVWVKDADLIVNVEQYSGSDRFGGLYLFRLRPGSGIQSVGRADAAGFDPDDNLQLDNYRETAFENGTARTRTARRLVHRSNVDLDLLQLAVIKAESLTARGLYHYIRYLERNDLDTLRYELAFWSRLAAVASVPLMALLALPFVFGPLRSSGAGARMILGVVLGLAYYLMNRTVEYSGEVFRLEPSLMAWLPGGLIAIAVLAGLLRVR